MNDAELLLDRCNKKLNAWRKIYKLLDQPFEYRRPTEAELDRYMTITIVNSYKTKPKDE